MPKQTKQERIAEYFLKGGLKEIIPSKSRKYRQFEKHDKVLGKKNYWVGRNGAVRYGKTVSKSISLTDLNVFKNM
jgi:hypothetical protein